MNDTDIIAAIDEAEQEVAKELGITQTRVLQELWKIATSNIKDYTTTDKDGDTVVDLNMISRDNAAALSELTIETSKGKQKIKRIRVKPYDKISAIIQVGKQLGMFKEQVEHSGSLTLEQLIEQSYNLPSKEVEPPTSPPTETE